MDRDLRHNLIVSFIDALCFGLALGIASFTTVSPLFVQWLGGSPLWVGLVAVLHPFGWHLTQLATAGHVSRLARYLPTVMIMTATERMPFFVLAGVALVANAWPRPLVLAVVMVLLFCIGLGGGLTATAYQALVGRIMPPHRVGAFYGLKAAAGNGGFVLGAVIAGSLMEAIPAPTSYAWCYGLAGLVTLVSWVFLGLTRERAADGLADGASAGGPATVRSAVPASADRAEAAPEGLVSHWRAASSSWRWFIVARMLAQLAMLPAAFLTVYAVTRFDIRPVTAGWMAAVFGLSQTLGNPVMGMLGDRFGHRPVMAVGMLLAALSAIVARVATSPDALFVAWALVGLANVASWTLPLALNLELAGEGHTRPYLIGLANTIYAPSVLLAAVAGGVLAEKLGYDATFVLAAIGAVASAWVLAAKVAGREAPSDWGAALSSPVLE